MSVHTSPFRGGTQFAIGSFTRDTSLASGNQSVTGVGFQPRTVLLLAAENTTSEVSIGVDDATNRGVLQNRHGQSAGTWGINVTQSINLFDGTNAYSGVVASMDSDGFTITWTKNGSPTGTARIIYLAIR